MQISRTTNVGPTDLNYNDYTDEQYDRDIVNSIPFHAELHEQIVNFLENNVSEGQILHALDLGTGTGISSQWLRKVFSNAELTVIDFSDTMLAGARKKLGESLTTYILGDYAVVPFGGPYDVIMCVIGLHHQTAEGVMHLLDKAYDALKPGGLLVIGDLMTVADKTETALHIAQHYHHLVEHAADEKTLREWAHHHCFLNDLKTVEMHEQWLRGAGFKIAYTWGRWSTRLIIAQKP